MEKEKIIHFRVPYDIFAGPQDSNGCEPLSETCVPVYTNILQMCDVMWGGLIVYLLLYCKYVMSCGEGSSYIYYYTANM